MFVLITLNKVNMEVALGGIFDNSNAAVQEVFRQFPSSTFMVDHFDRMVFETTHWKISCFRICDWKRPLEID